MCCCCAFHRSFLRCSQDGGPQRDNLTPAFRWSDFTTHSNRRAPQGLSMSIRALDKSFSIPLQSLTADMAVACRASSQRTEGTRSHFQSWWWRTSRTGGSRMPGELRAWLVCWPRRSVPPVPLPLQVLLPARGLLLHAHPRREQASVCLLCHSQGPHLCLAANLGSLQWQASELIVAGGR